MKTILLLSGGVDSLSAWFYMKKPDCLYIDLETKYSNKELLLMSKLEKMLSMLSLRIVKGINLGQFEQGEKAYIPYRNLILAAVAANYGEKIILAGIQDDRVEDKSPKAFESMSNCLNSIAKKKVEIFSPFWHMSKSEIIKWMLGHVPKAEEILRTSVSCYSGIVGQCGNCPSCLRKGVAFEACGLPLDFFENDVRQSSLISNYIKDMKNGLYTKKRTDETLMVFRKWGYKI